MEAWDHHQETDLLPESAGVIGKYCSQQSRYNAPCVHAERKAGLTRDGYPYCFDLDQTAQAMKHMQASASRFDSGHSFDLHTKAAQTVQPARQP